MLVKMSQNNQHYEISQHFYTGLPILQKKLQIYLTSNRYMAVEKYIHTSYCNIQSSKPHCEEGT